MLRFMFAAQTIANLFASAMIDLWAPRSGVPSCGSSDGLALDPPGSCGPSLDAACARRVDTRQVDDGFVKPRATATDRDVWRRELTSTLFGARNLCPQSSMLC